MTSLFLRDESFDTFLPLAWLDDGLMVSTSRIKDAPVRKNVGLDIYQFLRRGMVISGVVAAAIAMTPFAVQASQNVQQHLQIQGSALLNGSVSNFIEVSNQFRHAETLADARIEGKFQFGTGVLLPLNLSDVGAARTKPASLSNSLLVGGGSAHIAVRAQPIRYLFEPRPEVATRVTAIARGLEAIGKFVAYEGDGDEVILEAGMSGSSLTMILESAETTAIYRRGAGFALQDLVVVTLPAFPTQSVLSRLALAYSQHEGFEQTKGA